MEEKIKQLEKLKQTNKNLKICIGILILPIVIIFCILLYAFITPRGDYVKDNYISEEQEVRMFNESFTSYLGTSVTGQQVKSLVSTVLASNSKESDHQVTINEEPANNYKLSTVNTKQKYSAIEDTDEKGYIINITIGNTIE